MDDPRLREALLTDLKSRYTRAWEIEPWEAWLAELSGAELAAEAGILQLLTRDGTAMFNYRNAVLRNGDPVLTARYRTALARVISKGHMTQATFQDTVQALVDADPVEREEHVAALEALGREVSLSGVHSLLAASLRGIPPDLWPTGPLHAGELRPDIGHRGYPALGRYLASLLHSPALQARLLGAADTEAAQGRPDMAGSSLRPHTAKVVLALATADSNAEDPDATTFLEALDAALRRLDVVHALRKRTIEPTSPIARCVWRGDDGKAVRIHIAELEDGRFGLLAKLKRRYEWVEGSRDEIASTVPDGWFAGAMAAFASEL